jgi:hypothetical protein
MRIFVLATLLASLASWATAQRISAAPTHVAAARPPAAPPSTIIRRAIRGSDFAPFRASHHANPYQSLFSPFGIFPDYSYPDNPSPASGSPQVQPDLLMQALSVLGTTSLGTNSEPAKPDSQSLLIELHGDHYVSLTNAESPTNTPEPTIIPRSLKKQPARKPAAARELLPITLLFRDGHHEDVRDYTIADGVIYARGDFYSDGYWNKKIELSALDLPETVKSNEARGVRFVLPNAPNEVITRP